jgi:hypothetical protein
MRRKDAKGIESNSKAKTGIRQIQRERAQAFRKSTQAISGFKELEINPKTAEQRKSANMMYSCCGGTKWQRLNFTKQTEKHLERSIALCAT